MPATGRLRPFLEWAAAPPKGLARAPWYAPDAIAATSIFRAVLRTSGVVPALVVEAVYLLLRMLLLPRVARTILRRRDLRAYERRMRFERARPPTRPRSVRPRG